LVSSSKVEVVPGPVESFLLKRKAYLLRARGHVIVIELYHRDLLRVRLHSPAAEDFQGNGREPLRLKLNTDPVGDTTDEVLQ